MADARTDEALLEAYARGGEREALGELVRRHAGSLYGLAWHVLGDAHAAEDAIQETLVKLVRSARRYEPGRPARAWLQRIALNASLEVARSRRRRFAREEKGGGHVAREREVRSGNASPERAELAEHVRLAVAGLPEAFRLPIVLHYYQGLSVAEAAETLGQPRGTVLSNLHRGRERLRNALAGLGGALAVLPAAKLEGALAAVSSPAMPRTLALKLHTFHASRTAAAAAAAKGGLAMKMVAGVLAAGALAGVAAVSLPGSGSTPLPAEKPRKFATPVWHPEARWEKSKEHFAGLGLGGTFSMGELDGPRREVMWRRSMRPGLFGGLNVSGRYVFMSYDEKTERYHGVTAGAAGYLDGPFSRARFYGTDYIPRQSFFEAPSPDGRYVYMVTESWGDARLRCLDFVEQTVRSLPTGKATPLVVGVDGVGKVYTINYEQELVILDPAQDWKPIHTVALETKEKVGGLGRSIAPDEVHGRVYATTYRSKNYYVWYWDVKDGSFHGLVPHPPKGGPSRPGGMGGCTPGPFKGANFYNEGSVGFGPDDPERRFLYVGRIDDPSLYRLDLKKEEIWKFDSNAGRFIGTGERRHPAVTYGVMPTWFGDGSFMGTYMRLWRRVK